MTYPHSVQPRILVAFATRGGSTREIAEQVAQVLEEAGLAADLQPVTAVTDIEPYHAVVLGSALYFQRLMPQALQFLTNQASPLSARPLVLFSVGAEMRKGTPTARAAADEWVQRSLQPLPQIQPISIEHFAGAVELRRLGFWWRLLVLITFGERGDWRNLGSVRTWSSTIIPQLVGHHG